MKIFYTSLPKDDFSYKPVITLGMFDGVHLGHKAVISTALELAEKLKTKLLIVTFDTHPGGVIRQKKAPPMITSLAHRLLLFEKLKVDACLILPFNQKFAQLEAEQFVTDFLLNILEMQTIVLGEDACFGKGRQGNIKLLQSLASPLGFQVYDVSGVEVAGEIVSSTAIRNAVIKGNLQLAENMLERPVTVFGSVTTGAGIGRILGFPTLNLDLHHELHPPQGVYISRTCIGDTCWASVTNIGHRPTIDALNRHDVMIETHILQGNIGDLYGQEAEVQFIVKIRDEKKYQNYEQLTRAISDDVEKAKNYFANAD